jgi:hypothetical protein
VNRTIDTKAVPPCRLSTRLSPRERGAAEVKRPAGVADATRVRITSS